MLVCGAKAQSWCHARGEPSFEAFMFIFEWFRRMSAPITRSSKPRIAGWRASSK